MPLIGGNKAITSDRFKVNEISKMQALNSTFYTFQNKPKLNVYLNGLTEDGTFECKLLQFRHQDICLMDNKVFINLC